MDERALGQFEGALQLLLHERGSACPVSECAAKMGLGEEEVRAIVAWSDGVRQEGEQLVLTRPVEPPRHTFEHELAKARALLDAEERLHRDIADAHITNEAVARESRADRGIGTMVLFALLIAALLMALSAQRFGGCGEQPAELPGTTPQLPSP